MLTSTQISNDQKVLAWEVNKSDGPFRCPKCQNETILKRGLIKVPHFAHKPPIYCEYGKGESEMHRRCKNEIYAQLCTNNSITCELEKDLGKVVPDIYVDLGVGKAKIAIEVQISNLTMRRIIERTIEYDRLGVYVLWLSMYNKNLEQDRYSPKSWEKWLHMTYYGRVYYWMESLKVMPVHFGEYQIYVEETEWYEQGGEHRVEGGYYRKSRRYRTPKFGNPAILLEDFQINKRQAWSSGEVSVPECRILTDRQLTWWK